MLDVQNALNRKNVFKRRFTYENGEILSNDVLSLGIIPVFNFRFEFWNHILFLRNPFWKILCVFTENKIIKHKVTKRIHENEPKIFFGTSFLQYIEKFLFFLVGYLNSLPIEFFLKMISSSLGPKGFRYKKQFLGLIPVVITEELIKQIALLAVENIESQTSNTQSEIDQLIFQAFNLSREDIQLLKDFIQKSS